jgi:hypothetical protein
MKRSCVFLARWCCLPLALLGLSLALNAQSVARKHISDKHQHYYDSLKNMKYDRILPIWGDKVYKKGFDIPFPFGIMVNNFWGRQKMIIDNIHVGIRDGDSTFGPVDLSKVIEFSDVEAKVYNINIRADAWIFPFLNVYVLANYLPKATTSVNLSKPVSLSTIAEQSGWAYGFGIMGAGGVGPFWLQADYNATWADMQLLDNKVFTQIMGVRLGHVIPNNKDPQKNMSFWIGTMGMFLNNETVGEIPLSDLFPGLPQEKIDEIKQSYNDWYNDLAPPQQKVADKIVQRLQDRVNGIDVDDTHIMYTLDKKPESRWAGVVGAQYQFNKKWQLRAESNCIGGGRFSLLLSVNYRFLGFKKKPGS